MNYQFTEAVRGNPPVKTKLAESTEEFINYITQEENSDKLLFADTEASTLDTRRARLAGISVSLNPYSALYAPVGHLTRPEANLPLEPLLKVMGDKVAKDDYTLAFYNSKYDRNILQHNAVKLAKMNWEPEKHLDILELVYLKNPDRRQKGLKVVAKQDVDYDMAKFETLFTAQELKKEILDISTKDPYQCVDYACGDAIGLGRIWPLYKDTKKKFSFAVAVDTKLVDVIRKVEHNGGMRLNVDYIDAMMKVLEERREVLTEQIHRMVGYQFEINSPKQLGIALFEHAGIPSQGMTKGKNPQYSTDAETLEKLATTYPVVEFVISYRKVVKANSTYFAKLKRLYEMKIPVRVTFNMYSVPTFRFSAPGGNPELDGFTGVNIQAISNGEERDVMAVELQKQKEGEANYEIPEEDLLVEMVELEAAKKKDEEEYFKNPLLRNVKFKEDGLAVLETLPWVLPRLQTRKEEEAGLHPSVCIRDICNGCPADCIHFGIDTTRRIIKNVRMIPSVRQAFMAPEGYTLAELDYSKQELCIGANLSGETKWIEALNTDQDLHVRAAADAFNMTEQEFVLLPKEEYEAKRGIGKILNFAVFYGATGYTLARKANIPTAAGEQIYERFKQGHAKLFRWIDAVVFFARKNKYTTTYFGRERSLEEMYKDPTNKAMMAFGDRSAVNTSVQGTGAEVTRIAMVKVDHALKTKGYTRKEVFLVMMVHDSLMYAIRTELLNQIIPTIRENMMFNVKSWPVQLKVDTKVGTIWGKLEKQKVLPIAA